MTAPVSSKRSVRGLRLATLCVAAAVPLYASAAHPRLTFEQAFSAKREPSALHYQVVFASKGADHRLEVWRDHERRVKRRTDDAIETYAFREPGTSEFRVSILDLKRRIHTRIDRTNLYRIGNFTDWFDLGHGLKHPLAEYAVAEAQAPRDAPKAVGDCRWFDLTQDGKTTHVCWSSRDGIPLLIATQSGAVVWRVVAVDRSPLSATMFEVRDEGFIRNDANQDIERD